MHYLDAAFAFAITMLAVATIVTQVSRLVMMLASVRHKELEKMLSEFATKQFDGIIAIEMARLEKAVPGITAMVNGWTIAGAGSATSIQAAITSIGSAATNGGKRTELKTAELLQLLKRSNLGTNLLTQLGADADRMFDQVGREFDALGEKVTERFRTRNAAWGTVVGILVAVVLNVDAIFVAESFISNKPLRDAAIARLDSTVAIYEGVMRAASAEGLSAGASTSTVDSATAGSIDAKGTNVVAKLFEEVGKAQANVSNLTANAGLPFGYSYFPYAGSGEERGQDKWMKWLVGCVLTGLLAGMGAPFWYDAVLGIQRLTQRSKVK